MILGIVFFFFGHFLYIINLIIETGIRNFKKYFIFLIIISLIYFLYANFAFFNLKEGFRKGSILFPGACYIIQLALLNIASGVYAYTYFNIYAILVHIGTFIFTISDFVLARKMFYENNQYYQFILMATYILAQTLICFGMANKKNRMELGKKKKKYKNIKIYVLLISYYYINKIFYNKVINRHKNNIITKKLFFELLYIYIFYYFI